MINKTEDQSWPEAAWGKRCKPCKQHATSPPQRDIRCWLLKSSYVEASITHLLSRLAVILASFLLYFSSLFFASIVTKAVDELSKWRYQLQATSRLRNKH